jgi:HlyD family secretion protein
VAQGSRKWILLAAVAVVVLGAAAFLLTRRGGKVELLTGEVTRGSLDATVSATGTVNPVVMVHVGSQVSGTVAHLYADYNSRVKAGQLLLKLDPAIYDAQLAQSQANHEKARVTTVDALRAYKRAEELFGQNYISRADRDAAQTAYESAVASQKQAQAAVNLSKVNLNHCTIVSPIDGEVISRSVDVGQTVAASLQAPELFLIANDLTRMQVETSIDEADIGKLKPGQPVSFTVDAFPDETFRGRVTLVRSEPLTVQNVVTYTTVIEVANPDLKLRPGMTANVSILVAHKDDVLKVPNAALRFKPSAEVAARLGLKTDKRGAQGGRSDSAGQSARGDSQGARADRSAGTEQHARRDSSQGAGRERAAGAWAAHGDSSRRAGARGGASGARAARADSSGRGGMRGTWAAKGDGGTSGGGGTWSAGGSRTFRPKARIYVETAPGKLTMVSVRTGLSDGSFTEVLSGDLKAGTKVATGVLGATKSQSQSSAPGMGMGGPPGGQRR